MNIVINETLIIPTLFFLNEEKQRKFVTFKGELHPNPKFSVFFLFFFCALSKNCQHF